MIAHTEITDVLLRKLIRTKAITLAGNRTLKIYGRLNCNSGKKIKRRNRVFFRDTAEATQNGYRPCGHCLRQDYKMWKNGLIHQ